ncbi:MAG: hypothetical protein ACRDJE_26725 [Dehalococcoidia bacterium]
MTVPRRWEVKVERLTRYQTPLVYIRFNGRMGWVARVAIATSEPFTTLAPDTAAAVRHELTHEKVPEGRRGRRIVPGDAGRYFAPLIRVESLEIETVGGVWVSLGTVTAVITNRPRALGVGGLLGGDILSRFTRFEYQIGPPDRLIVEQP